MVKIFKCFDGMELFEDESEQAWVQDGLALQIKFLTERGEIAANAAATMHVPTSTEEMYLLCPENTSIDRARECADEFGKCSIEEMKDLIPSECPCFDSVMLRMCGTFDSRFLRLCSILFRRNTALQQHRETGASQNVHANATDTLEEDEVEWLQEGLELQIALRQKSRQQATKYDRST